ncbi:ribonuclease H-like domain-containing protein [Desulfomonile tiedjei]|uniref:Putative exonuclease n=1 Tax=Desulfomonile tiedjei (strain ATCC 49306 / DSM 6799 / DCB-1) TaxID=706587 RepID=I4CDM9_DESTA|nr:ribonuclease H-like domain-containing protein [Desulfomonile tiedjei]AFM27670.1 putative exonuclease [Desulfomonile tiedjei DSM 6799]
MLLNTFCHVPGIGLKSEAKLWSQGLLRWEDALSAPSDVQRRYPFLQSRMEESLQYMEQRDPGYFGDHLPSDCLWRIFPEFRDSTAYLDIETNGLAGHRARVTTIALFDGKIVRYYVTGENLEQFRQDISQYKVLVTYNGVCFDVPFIEQYLHVPMNHVHIDLRFLLKSLGYTGGLKGCEKKFGIDRRELDGVNGYFAVLLWRDFRENKNDKALETLLAYNVLDAVNLEFLMVSAYNLKVQGTPFADTHCLSLPEAVENPFRADLETVERIISYIEHTSS